MDCTQQAFQQFAQMLSSGLKQLQDHCSGAYPRHLQPDTCFRPEKSFILEAGTDPLDYIYVYRNPGQPDRDIPKHWHYIGLGLSDIHGYSKFCEYHEMLRQKNDFYFKSTEEIVNVYPPQKDQSGFGFELTMRVKCNSDDEWGIEPPKWPAKVLQDLARYVFQSKNTFNVGDHVAWHSPLDSSENGPESSRIVHVLMALDPQLTEIGTHHGQVKFIQVVGVCNEELDAARQWNVRGILEMMREREATGGPFLVTDMRRGETIFDLDPEKYDRLRSAIEGMGSDMVQISARHKTSSIKPDWFANVNYEDHSMDGKSVCPHRVNADRLVRGPAEMDQVLEEDEQPPRPSSRMSLGSESNLCIENIERSDTRYYNSMYLLLSNETASVLPVMLSGRLAHKRHFSIQNFKGDSLVTFIPEGCSTESLVTPPHLPYARRLYWTQIYVSEELRKQMERTIMPDFSRGGNCLQNAEEDEDISNDQLKQPRNYSWPEFNFHITIVDEIADN